ncbi:carbon-nitrogen hydrolase family protein [Kaarinaea lacus]
MSRAFITRRQFSKWLASSLLLGSPLVSTKAIANKSYSTSQKPPAQIQAAAIQMVPRLADVQWNMNQAEQLIRTALKKGAQWIILPEMFTSAVAFHPNMHKAIQDFDGAPLKMLKKLSREGSAVIGGSFLAKREQQVFNTFVLVFPDGNIVQHDKDVPTYWENCYYKGGKDDGVLPTPIGTVGSVLCWEFIRSQTAKRLSNKVNLVVGGSCWWTLPDDADADSPRRADNLKMLQEAAPRMAKMLGVPVIHGSHAGKFQGFFSPELPDVEYNSAYLGEAMIVDAQGKVLARRAQKSGEGVVHAKVDLVDKPVPSQSIPDSFWIPKEMPDDWKSSWERWRSKGADYYKLVTEQYLKTGNIPDYVPEYLR